MPEIPDLSLYLARLQPRLEGARLEALRLASPFVLRSVTPSPTELLARRVEGLERIGKRIVLRMEGGYWIAIHLMRAGRFRWQATGAKLPGRIGLAAFDFDRGCLLLTEASPKKRASILLGSGEAELRALDAGGLELQRAQASEFAARLELENRTLKRFLTDPRLVAGVGNAYSDEILHAARLSPLRRTRDLSRDEAERLFTAAREVLDRWTAQLLSEDPEGFPERVTAFREGMAVHGRYREPCPVCGAPVQRIVFAESETNYCARCQNEGRLLADRSLSRLLKEDWPRNLDELEERRKR